MQRLKQEASYVVSAIAASTASAIAMLENIHNSSQTKQHIPSLDENYSNKIDTLHARIFIKTHLNSETHSIFPRNVSHFVSFFAHRNFTCCLDRLNLGESDQAVNVRRARHGNRL